MAEQTEAQRQAEQRRQDEQRQAEERRHDEMHRQAQARSQEGQERAQGRAAERQQDAPLRQRPPDERPRDESTIDRRELLRREQTPPPPEMTPPPDPLLVMDPVLRDSLEALDRDVNGEIRFCRQAAEALRSFQYRWSTDAPVEDGYGKAIQALENLDSILRGAEIRTTEDVTRKVLGRLGAAQHARTAEAAREHAVQWAETPVPQETQARQDDRAKRPVPPEAGVVA